MENATMVSLETILDPTNLRQALKQVVSNRGAPGVDGMAVDALDPFIRAHPNRSEADDVFKLK